MPVTSKTFPLFTPKVHPRVCRVIWIIFQLQRTAIENARIDTIDMINRINCINQYEDNWYNQTYRFTLQTSSTQLHHCCFLFRFEWLIKVRSIVLLHTVSYCWCNHISFIFCFCLPLNPTVVPTLEVIIISQEVMDYCCVYHGQLFLPGFLLLTEPSSCVTGAINWNKEDLTIMSSLTQYDYHQSSDVLI